VGYKTSIQAILESTAYAGSFPEAVYSVARPSILSEGSAQAVKSAEANEIRGAFGIDSEYGRDYRQERQGWAWLLIIRLDTEVVLEDFETALMRSPLTIAQDTADGRDQQVIMLLEESSYEHPPRGGASNGTEVTYRFVAELCQQ